MIYCDRGLFVWSVSAPGIKVDDLVMQLVGLRYTESDMTISYPGFLYLLMKLESMIRKEGRWGKREGGWIKHIVTVLETCRGTGCYKSETITCLNYLNACIQNNVNLLVITTTRPTGTVLQIDSNDVMRTHQTGRRRGCEEGQRRDRGERGETNMWADMRGRRRRRDKHYLSKNISTFNWLFFCWTLLGSVSYACISPVPKPDLCCCQWKACISNSIDFNVV